MDKKDLLKSVYDDFFGVEKLEKRNRKLADEIAQLGVDLDNMPEINVPTGSESLPVQDNELKEKPLNRDEFMANLFSDIDNLYITDDSKSLLKKIIEYMRKYDEKIEKNYISFNMKVYSEDKKLMESISKIVLDGACTFHYIKDGVAATYSLYDVDEVSKIEEMYNERNAVVVLKDFEALLKAEDTFKDKFINKFKEFIDKTESNVITILNANSNEKISESFKGDEDILRKFENFEIAEEKPEVQDAYQEVLERLEGSIEKTDEFQVKLLDYISVTYPNNTLPYPEYVSSLVNKIAFNKEVPVYEKDKTQEEIFAELNELVGLKKVKEMLKDLVNLIELKQKSGDDLKIKNINLHMVFLGNPGTGKTTVARIIAEMLYNLKYIKQNKLIEVSSKDLVAEYVGQTAPKTNAVIEKALGGVLFVDEAYSLASGDGQGNSFNEEAIATLIQGMENHRDELVVIFAGYTKEMQAFLDANSGIVSRIGYTVEFEDYTTDELIQIFQGFMTKSGFIVEDKAIEKVKKIIEEYRDTKNFGNARFVRNIYEKAIVKHASNTKGKKQKKILKTITEDDINTEALLKM